DDTGRDFSVPKAVVADAASNFVVSGVTSSQTFPTLNGFQTQDRRRSLYRLGSDGVTWSVADSGALRSVRSIEFDYQNPGHMFTATDAGAMVSSDSGATWKPLPTGFNPNGSAVLKVHPLNAKYMILVANDGTVSVTRDGASTWSGLGVGARG